jgi:hypothetical protein
MDFVKKEYGIENGRRLEKRKGKRSAQLLLR